MLRWNPLRRGRRWLTVLGITASCLALGTEPGSAAEPSGYYTPPVNTRGQGAHRVYLTDGQVESIDPASGNLMLSLPLGQVYSVGPKIRYQFRVRHNSNAWDSVRVACSNPPHCEDQSFSVPNPSSNAGLGWELHFGKLFPYARPSGLDPVEGQLWPRVLDDVGTNVTEAPWLYIAPDGSRHAFRYRGDYPQTGGSYPTFYTTDGSYTRLQQVSASRVEIDTPDGVRTLFERVSGQEAGTIFCRSGVSGCWRLLRIEDRFDNAVDLSYQIAGNTETWTVSDSTGRRHFLRFDRSDLATGGGDGGGAWTTGNGDEFGDLRRLLTEVDVAAFDDARAVYRFRYREEGGTAQNPATTLLRGCPHDFPGGPATLTTRILETVELPDSQPYTIETATSDTVGQCSDMNGKVTRLGLPTQGKYAYEYGPWRFPTRCDFSYNPTPELEPSYTQLGVVRKRTLGHPSTSPQLAVWDYEPELIADPPLNLPPNLPGELYGSNCRRADVIRTVVKEPTKVGNHRVHRVYYNSVTEGRGALPSPSTPRSGGWRVTDHGLPYTVDQSVGPAANPLFLSTEVWEGCSATCAPGVAPESCAGCQKKRSEFVRYAMEYRPCSKTFSGDSLSCFRANASLQAKRTVFEDDPLGGGEDRWVETSSSDWDGAGHWKSGEVADNFNGTLRAATTTQDWSATGQSLTINPTTGYFQVGAPASYLPAGDWLLNGYEGTTETDNGITFVTEARFNQDGQLACVRQRMDPQQRTADDVIRILEYNSQGLVSSETIAGGDGGNLPAAAGGDPCVLPPLGPGQTVAGEAIAGRRIRVDHAYQHLVLESSGIAGFPYQYRAAIDKNTGLPKETFEVAGETVPGVGTQLVYDRLGRLTRILPDPFLGGAETQIRYDNPLHKLAKVTTEQLVGAQSLGWTTTKVEEFGLPIQERVRRPLPGDPATAGTSKRNFGYDRVGNLLFTTTLQPAASSLFDPDKRTSFEGYDAFGRPAREIRPDGEVVSFTYQGARRRTSTRRVYTEQGFENVSITETFDGRGRVVRVDTPLYVETAVWDPRGRPRSRTRSSGGVAQTRVLETDGRDFLVAETHPEIGYEGSPPGTLTYRRDALGQVRERFTGLYLLSYDYDAGGRLVAERNSGGQLLQEWAYGTGNAGNNLAYGKLVRAARYNYPLDTQDPWVVAEEYEYRGKLGLLDRKTVQLQRPLETGNQRWGAAFEQVRTYDALGRVIAEDLPQCIDVPQTGEQYCNDPHDEPLPAHRVTRSWNHGMLTAVESNFNIRADYAYHPNLQLASADYATGAGTISQSVFAQGSEGMVRTQRIQHSKAGAATPFFDSGFYAYDGASNIWQIGANRYTYDPIGRLLSGTVAEQSPATRADYTYDAFDNMMSATTDQGWVDFQVDVTKNRVRGVLTPWQECLNSWVHHSDGNLVLGNSGCDGLTLVYSLYDPLSMPSRFTLGPLGGVDDDYFLWGPGNYRFLSFDIATGIRTYSLRDLAGDVARQVQSHGWGPGANGERFFAPKDFVRGPTGLIATRNLQGVKRFFYHDHLGTPRVVADGSGNVLSRNNYYPFGEPVTGFAYTEPASSFTGHEAEAFHNAYYMKGRFLDNTTHRFRSPDPARDGWNLYAYVGNNPIRFNDPTGFSEEEAQGPDGNPDAKGAEDEDPQGVFADMISVTAYGTDAIPNFGTTKALAEAMVREGNAQACSGFNCEVLASTAEAADDITLMRDLSLTTTAVFLGGAAGAIPEMIAVGAKEAAEELADPSASTLGEHLADASFGVIVGQGGGAIAGALPQAAGNLFRLAGAGAGDEARKAVRRRIQRMHAENDAKTWKIVNDYKASEIERLEKENRWLRRQLDRR